MQHIKAHCREAVHVAVTVNAIQKYGRGLLFLVLLDPQHHEAPQHRRVFAHTRRDYGTRDPTRGQRIGALERRYSGPPVRCHIIYNHSPENHIFPFPSCSNDAGTLMISKRKLINFHDILARASIDEIEDGVRMVKAEDKVELQIGGLKTGE